ncbi:MAG: hypothetical protein NVSMB70_13470 [Chamaesiphon sp.]
MVQSEQSVKIAELKANAQIKQATGEAESTKLRAVGEADAIRATGNAKAETYRTGVEALGAQSYTSMQLMQIIGDRNVRLIPDVLVSGNNGGNGLVDGLLTMLLWNQAGNPSHSTSDGRTSEPLTESRLAQPNTPSVIPKEFLPQPKSSDGKKSTVL